MSLVFRQTPFNIDLVVMCPAMDLAALSMFDANAGHSHIVVYRTTNDSSATASASAAISREASIEQQQQQQQQQNPQQNQDADGAAAAAPASTSAAASAAAALDAPPLFSFTIKGSQHRGDDVSSSREAEDDDDDDDEKEKEDTRIVAMQWGPAGGRLLAVATATKVYILHVELHALLRVHRASKQDTQRAASPTAWHLSSLNQSQIVALAWDKVTPEQQQPQHTLASSASPPSCASSPFPCFKLLSASVNDVGGKGSSDGACGSGDHDGGDECQAAASRCSPRLVEVAEAEWAAGGAASLLLVMFADGRISILLGGLYELTILSPSSSTSFSISTAALLSSAPTRLFVGNYIDKRKPVPSSSDMQIVVQSGTTTLSTPLDAALRIATVSVARRVACQTREVLVKIACDLHDVHRRWVGGVDKILERALPAVLWSNRAAIAATLLTGAPLPLLMERRELEQSTLVAAAESLRDLSAGLLRSVVDVMFECIGYVQDNSAALQAASSSNSGSGSCVGLPGLVAALRSELCEWIKHMSGQRDLLSALLRWLHHFVGSTRAAAVAAQLAAGQADNNQDDNANNNNVLPSPAVSTTDPSDFLVAFDVLTADYMMMMSGSGDCDDSSSSSSCSGNSKPRLPVHTSVALEKHFRNAVHAAHEAMRRIDQSQKIVTAHWGQAASTHGNLVTGNSSSRAALQWHYDESCGAVAVSIGGAHQLIVPVGRDDDDEQEKGSSSNNNNKNNDEREEVISVSIDTHMSSPHGLDVYTVNSLSRTTNGGGSSVVAIRRDIYDRDEPGEPLPDQPLSGLFRTQFAANAQQPVRLYPNSCRDIVAVVRGKKIQFLDVTDCAAEGEQTTGNDDAE